MKKFIALLILVIGLLASTVLGQDKCPVSILLHGPEVIGAHDEPMPYKVTIEPINRGWPLEYIWTVASGKIVSGQGTSSVMVLRGEIGRSTTVTVEMRGLPEKECPYILSETSPSHVPLTPIKIAVWKSETDLGPIRQFSSELADNPHDGGYVFIVRGASSTDNSLAELRRAVLHQMPTQSAPSRITFVEADGPSELVEMWRVPPGANNPKCESCISQCPTITVTGPAGIWQPGESITFSASVEPSDLRNFTFHWTVEDGKLIDGQGNSVIKVKTPDGLYQRITATVIVSGLPANCPTTASEVGQYNIDPTYILLDERSTPPKEINKASLEILAKRLADFPADYGYIIEYFPPKTPKAVIQRKIDLIKSYLLKRGQAENEYKIVTAQADRPSTKIFAVPPGVEFPVPLFN
jgi:hypothetical protein